MPAPRRARNAGAPLRRGLAPPTCSVTRCRLAPAWGPCAAAAPTRSASSPFPRRQARDRPGWDDWCSLGTPTGRESIRLQFTNERKGGFAIAGRHSGGDWRPRPRTAGSASGTWRPGSRLSRSCWRPWSVDASPLTAPSPRPEGACGPGRQGTDSLTAPPTGSTRSPFRPTAEPLAAAGRDNCPLRDPVLKERRRASRAGLRHRQPRRQDGRRGGRQGVAAAFVERGQR